MSCVTGAGAGGGGRGERGGGVIRGSRVGKLMERKVTLKININSPAEMSQFICIHHVTAPGGRGARGDVERAREGG